MGIIIVAGLNGMGEIVIKSNTKRIAFLLCLVLPIYMRAAMYPMPSIANQPFMPSRVPEFKQPESVPLHIPIGQPSVPPVVRIEQKGPGKGTFPLSLQGQQRKFIPGLEKQLQSAPQVSLVQPKTYLELFEIFKKNSPIQPKTFIFSPEAFKLCLEDAQQKKVFLYIITTDSITTSTYAKELLELFKQSSNEPDLFIDDTGAYFFQACEILGGYFCYFNVNLAEIEPPKSLFIVLAETKNKNLSAVFNQFNIPVNPNEIKQSLVRIVLSTTLKAHYDLIIKRMKEVKQVKQKKAAQVEEEKRLAQEKAEIEAEEQKLAQEKAFQEEQQRKAAEERLAVEATQAAQEKAAAETQVGQAIEQPTKTKVTPPEKAEKEPEEEKHLASEEQQKAQLKAEKEAESARLTQAIKQAEELAVQEQERIRAQELAAAQAEEERLAAERQAAEIDMIVKRINTIDDLLIELQSTPSYSIPAAAFNKVIAHTKKDGYRIIFMTENIIKSLWGTAIEPALYPLFSENKKPITLQDITNNNGKILLRYAIIPGGALFLKPQISGNFDPLILTDPSTDATTASTMFKIPFEVQIQSTADSTFFANFFDTVLAKLQAETEAQEKMYQEESQKEAIAEQQSLEAQKKALAASEQRTLAGEEEAIKKEEIIQKKYEEETAKLQAAQRDRQALAEQKEQNLEAEKIKKLLAEEQEIERKSFETRKKEEAQARLQEKEEQKTREKFLQEAEQAFAEKTATKKRLAMEQEAQKQELAAQTLAEQKAIQAEQEKAAKEKIISTVKTVPNLIAQLQKDPTAQIPQQALEAVVQSAKADKKRIVFMSDAVVEKLKDSPMVNIFLPENISKTLQEIKDNDTIIMQYAKIPHGILFLQPTKENFAPLVITTPQSDVSSAFAEFNIPSSSQLQSPSDPAFLETFFTPIVNKIKREKEAQQLAEQKETELIATQKKAEAEKQLSREKELAEQQEKAEEEVWEMLQKSTQETVAKEKAEEETWTMLQESVQKTAAEQKEKIINTVKTADDLVAQLQTDPATQIPHQTLEIIIKSAKADKKRILFIAQDILKNLQDNSVIQKLLPELFVENNEKMALQSIKDPDGNIVMQYAKLPEGAIILVQQDAVGDFAPLIITSPNTDSTTVSSQFSLAEKVQIQSPYDSTFLKKLFEQQLHTISQYAKLEAAELAKVHIKRAQAPEEEELGRQQLRIAQLLPEFEIGKQLPIPEKLEQKSSTAASQTARNQAEKIAQQLEEAAQKRTIKPTEEETAKPEREFGIEASSYVAPPSTLSTQLPRGTSRTTSTATSVSAYRPTSGGGYAAATTPSYSYTSPTATAYGDYTSYAPRYGETGGEAESYKPSSSYYEPMSESSYPKSTYTYEYEEPEEVMEKVEEVPAVLKGKPQPKPKIKRKKQTRTQQRAARRLEHEAQQEQTEAPAIKPRVSAKKTPKPTVEDVTKTGTQIESPKTTFEVYYRQAIQWTIDKVTDLVTYVKKLFGMT